MTTTTELPSALDLPKPRTGWRTDAACDLRAVGKRPCGTCPVRWDCLLDAVRADDQTTFRAAMNPAQRNAWLIEEGYTRPPGPNGGKSTPHGPGRRAHIDMDIVNKRRAAGVNWDEIAPIFGCTAETVARHWRQARQPPKAGSKAKSFRALKPLDLDAVGRMLAENASFEAIGRALGVHPSTVVRQWRQSQAGGQA